MSQLPECLRASNVLKELALRNGTEYVTLCYDEMSRMLGEGSTVEDHDLEIITAAYYNIKRDKRVQYMYWFSQPASNVERAMKVSDEKLAAQAARYAARDKPYNEGK